MIILNGNDLTLELLVKIARENQIIDIDENARKKVEASSHYLKDIANQDHPVYGINTGFGHLSKVKVDKSEINQLQINLLKSHACGVGDPLSIEVVRAMMALRINALVKGYSGIRLSTILKLMELLNKNIIPVVFEKGSLGASGDLALLSHMSLPLVGLGEVYYKGQRMDTKEAFKLGNIEPIDHLKAKEGLSLINGTQGMCAIGGLVLYDAIHLIAKANLALSMTMEALHAIPIAFLPQVHEIRNQIGQMIVAEEVMDNIEGSTYLQQNICERVQDAYSIRCAPQVHGASLDAINHVYDIVSREINAVTDNPLVFYEEDLIISAGNFHGQPLALAFDYLGIAISELANISERRIERMVNPNLSNGLPPFLVKKPGINSGFMIVQYTAASLVSENKVLSHPASVDSIPSSANQEDHVSMGSISARKAKMILDHATKVISMEMMTAAQAIDLREPKQMGAKTKKVYQKIRKIIPLIHEDVIMYPYLHQMENLIKDQTFLDDII